MYFTNIVMKAQMSHFDVKIQIFIVFRPHRWSAHTQEKMTWAFSGHAQLNKTYNKIKPYSL